MLLSSGIVFAVMPIARYLVAAGVDRVVLERSPCFGCCPGYRLTVLSDGTAVYTGISFVRLRRTYRTRLDARVFERLANVLQKRGMFTARHGRVVADAPATRISIVFETGNVVNSVSYGFGGDDLDDDVDAGATSIDGFAGRLCDWHRTEPPLPAAVWGW